MGQIILLIKRGMMNMTEERFVIGVESEFQENAVFKGDEFICFEDDSECLVGLLNKQDKENKILREMLKNSCINQICENCEYGHYYSYELPFQGIEYDFECLKKHFGNEHWRCAELKECDDFKLKLEELND